MKQLIFLALFLISNTISIYSQELKFSFWLNSYRTTFNLKALQQDELLDLTARKYANEISQSGHFSHIDLKGQRAQTRYSASGGTHALVGEILGIGPDMDRIVDGWLHSEKHLAVIRDKRWTHYGQGFFFIKSKLIYVLLFSEQSTSDISDNWNEDRDFWHLKGNWLLPDKQPVLYNGIKPVAPVSWDRTTGQFSYQIEASELSAYLRLGYLETGKTFHVTNIFYPFK